MVEKLCDSVYRIEKQSSDSHILFIEVKWIFDTLNNNFGGKSIAYYRKFGLGLLYSNSVWLIEKLSVIFIKSFY